MKKMFLCLIATFVYCFVTAQTAPPVNPIGPVWTERNVVGSDPNTIPSSSSWGVLNAPLLCWSEHVDGFDYPYPMFVIANPNAEINLGIATEPGALGIDKNDIVLSIAGTECNKMLFNLNTYDEYNTRFFKFGTNQNSCKALVVSNSDRVGIGTDNFPASLPDPSGDNYRLYVKGGIKAEEVKVELCNGWCDYVFAKDYKLMNLKKLKEFLVVNKHLPNMPSAQMLANNGGFELGKMVTQQQEKIEESTLYIIQLNEQLEQIKKENELLKKRLLAIEKKLAK